jgi:hypothetical protein
MSRSAGQPFSAPGGAGEGGGGRGGGGGGLPSATHPLGVAAGRHPSGPRGLQGEDASRRGLAMPSWASRTWVGVHAAGGLLPYEVPRSDMGHSAAWFEFPRGRAVVRVLGKGRGQPGGVTVRTRGPRSRRARPRRARSSPCRSERAGGCRRCRRPPSAPPRAHTARPGTASMSDRTRRVSRRTGLVGGEGDCDRPIMPARSSTESCSRAGDTLSSFVLVASSGWWEGTTRGP